MSIIMISRKSIKLFSQVNGQEMSILGETSRIVCNCPQTGTRSPESTFQEPRWYTCLYDSSTLGYYYHWISAMTVSDPAGSTPIMDSLSIYVYKPGQCVRGVPGDTVTGTRPLPGPYRYMYLCQFHYTWPANFCLLTKNCKKNQNYSIDIT